MKTFPIDNLRIVAFNGTNSIVNEIEFYGCDSLFGNYNSDWASLPVNLKRFQEAYNYLSHQHVFAFNAIRRRMNDD